MQIILIFLLLTIQVGFAKDYKIITEEGYFYVILSISENTSFIGTTYDVLINQGIRIVIDDNAIRYFIVNYTYLIINDIKEFFYFILKDNFFIYDYTDNQLFNYKTNKICIK